MIDPARDIDRYLDAAAAEGLTMVAAAETHIHADFVSGCRALADQAGTLLYLSGEGAADWHYQYLTDYPLCLLRNRDRWRIGHLSFETLHVPGHTPEHLAFLVTDYAAVREPMGIFSGDFMFVGDVGRPDLLEVAVGIKGASEAGARALFRSLQAFKQLPDYLQIWPTHSAGSACGRALGAVPSTTVGYERRTNWAFRISDEAEFVTRVLADQPEPPRYFAIVKRLNREGVTLPDGEPQPRRLTLDALESLRQAGAPIMDTRPHGEFARSHIPGTFNNPFALRSFVTYAGSFLDYDRPFYLIIEAAHVKEATADLQRIGLDNCAGFFTPDQVAGWAGQPGHQPGFIPQVTALEIAADVEAERVTVIDVRSAVEFAAGHLPHAHNLPLPTLLDHLAEIPLDGPVLLQCQSGFRSGLAAGLLAAQGRTNLLNLQGGHQAWLRAAVRPKKLIPAND
jgi:hydroxyacylglutathione hydrolase